MPVIEHTFVCRKPSCPWPHPEPGPRTRQTSSGCARPACSPPATTISLGDWAWPAATNARTPATCSRVFHGAKAVSELRWVSRTFGPQRSRAGAPSSDPGVLGAMLEGTPPPRGFPAGGAGHLSRQTGASSDRHTQARTPHLDTCPLSHSFHSKWTTPIVSVQHHGRASVLTRKEFRGPCRRTRFSRGSEGWRRVPPPG